MLQLASISLVQFKNYISHQFHFDKKVVCITGNNGIGKTNLLDAIYYLCFTRSYFNAQDAQNIAYGHDGFRVAGHFLRKGNEEELTCTFRLPLAGSGGKKEISLNKTSYSRFSRHLGYFPCVMVAPDDAVLISGGSEQRRRFIDTILSQTDTAYLDHLIAYQKILQQRNALLKNASDAGSIDDSLLAVLDRQLAHHGDIIFELRKNFVPDLIEKMQFFYNKIAGTGEISGLEYQSSLYEKPLEEILRQNRSRDQLLQRTTDGIHRDDLIFFLNRHPVKQSASQGQRKNFLFALKLAQYEILRSAKGFSPILLLDDLFEKLDHDRIAHLIDVISHPDFGQVFITDTDEGRLKEAFAEEYDQVQVIRL